MALQLRTVETAPFEWVWERDSDVRMMVRPLSPEIERRASKASGVTAGMDGQIPIARTAEHEIVKAHAVIESWQGVEENGVALPVTRKNVQWLADQGTEDDPFGVEIIVAVVRAATKRYNELAALAGNSPPQSSGTSSVGSTAAANPTTTSTQPPVMESSGGNA
ncbi:MAG: hypothetical protein ACPGWS_07865, partial [Solirubrobacterales bacterium]